MRITTNPTKFSGNEKMNLNKARQICNLVRREFPYESEWQIRRIEMLKPDISKTRYKKLISKHNKNYDKLVEMRTSYFGLSKNPFEFYKKVAESLTKWKTINCGESEWMTYLVARINGINDSDITFNDLAATMKPNSSYKLLADIEAITADLFKHEGKEALYLDHVVSSFKGDNNIYGIDSALGEVDTVENLLKTYETKYSKALQVPYDSYLFLKEYKHPILSDEEAKELATVFPNLTLNNKNAKEKSFWDMFISFFQ